jgi:hypothetical protein
MELRPHQITRELNEISAVGRLEAIDPQSLYFPVDLKYRRSGGFCPFFTGIRKPSSLTK